MKIAFEDIGEGPTLLFTHGWLMSHQVWDHQLPLSKDFRIILWDLPHHGASSHEAMSIGLADCAEALHQLIEQRNLTEISFIGWSMGMSVFWKYLEDYGAKPFKNIINIEMLPKLDPRQTVVEAVENSMARDRDHATRKFLQRVFHQPDEAELEPIIAAANEVPLNSALRLYREMSEADFTMTASTVELPQSICLGRHGFYTDQEEAFRKCFPKTEIHWFEKSGHAPFWEEADAFNEFLKSEFLP